MSKTLCFTGKRPKDLYGYNDTYEYGRLLRDVEAKLYEFYTKFNVRTFISGGAQGFDQVAFWAVERMKRDYGLNDVINIVITVTIYVYNITRLFGYVAAIKKGNANHNTA